MKELSSKKKDKYAVRTTIHYYYSHNLYFVCIMFIWWCDCNAKV